MKRTILGLATILVVLSIVLVAFGVRPVRTVKAQTSCSNRTLIGNYGWTEFGYEPEESPPTFWTETALVTFDGHGDFSGSNVWEVDNGAFYLDFPTDFTSGKYIVYPNCTVEITYTWDAESYTDHGVVVGANGSEVIAAEQGPETTGQVDIKQIVNP